MLQLLQQARATCAKEVASTKLHLQVSPLARALHHWHAHCITGTRTASQSCHLALQSLRNSLAAARKVLTLEPPSPLRPSSSTRQQEYSSLMNQVAAKEASVVQLRKQTAAPAANLFT